MASTFLVAKNRAYSKLAAALTAGATSLSVTAGHGARFPSTYPFHLTIDDEIVSCTNRSTDTLTIARAQQSTTAAVHGNKSFVALNITAKSVTDLNTAVNTLEATVVSAEIVLGDDKFVKFGAGTDAQIGYETADANAFAMVFALPHATEDANNVPVAVFGDLNIVNVDLTFFNGITGPTIAVVDADRDSYVKFGFNSTEDDKGEINKGGNAWLNIQAGGSIPAAATISSGLNGISGVYDFYPTLTAGQEYRAGYFRANYRSTTPGNPAVNDFTGVEGVAASYTTEEAITFRGGHFRTYINADTSSTMRSAMGAEISARASYSGGAECVTDTVVGVMFTGARIWMAPFFTSASLQYINNFWGLWIYGEHATQRNADSAIKISDAGGGFTYDITFQEGTTLVDDGTDLTLAGANLVLSGEDLSIVTTDADDPKIIFSHSGHGTAHQIDILLDESATHSHLDIEGKTAGQTMVLHVVAYDTNVAARLQLSSGGNSTTLEHGAGDNFTITPTSGKLIILAGAVTQSFALTATTGGEEATKLTITDAATQSSGMNRAFVVDLTVSGAKSGSASSEGISVDLTLSGNTYSVYGSAIWITDSGNANHVITEGLNIYLEDMGSGTVEHIMGLDIGINATNLASGRHTGLRIRSHSGTPKSAIDVEAAFVVGLDFYNGFTPGDFSTADIRFHHGATLLDDGTNLTLAGANFVGTLGAVTFSADNTWSVAQTGVTLTSPAINGTVTTTALSLPGFTMVGTSKITNLSYATLSGAGQYSCNVANSYWSITGGIEGVAGGGSVMYLTGVDQAGTGKFEWYTPNAAGNADTLRMLLSGKLAIARLQLTATALNVGSSTHATPLEGDVRIAANKLNVYLNGAWEVVTSS